MTYTFLTQHPGLTIGGFGGTGHPMAGGFGGTGMPMAGGFGGTGAPSRT